MKAIVSVCLIVVVATALARPDGPTYDPKYDSVDWEMQLTNDRLRKAMTKCLVDKGPCSPEGKDLKDHVPDALQTECSKCTPKQKEATEKVIYYLIHNDEESWKELQAKFDPTGKYTKKYQQDYERLKNKKE